MEEAKNKENSVTFSKSDANKLKLDFFVQIRDRLKKKLGENVLVGQQGQGMGGAGQRQGK